MNILVTRFHGGSLGGAERSAYDHFRAFKKLGHSARFLTSAKLAGENSHFVPRLKLLRWIWLWLVLPPRALFGRYDIINPHSREDQIIFSLTKWLHRTPVVWKDPGDLIHNIKLGREGLLGRINQWLLIKVIKKSDGIYTLNREDKGIILDRLEKLGHPIPDDKFSVVPSDILFTDYNLKAKPPNTHRQVLQNLSTSSESSTNHRPLVLGTIIRLDEHKGVQYLLEAARNLSAKHKNLEFWIVGDGPYRTELETMSDGLDNVFFFGHQDDISPYLSGMDIFVQPAEFEGWGRNVKEAMYFSLPVVGSDVGGIAEQIDDGQTGLLFEPKNVAKLTRLLKQLIDDAKLRRKLGENAHIKVVKDGDYVNLVKTKILPLFNKVLQPKP